MEAHQMYHNFKSYLSLIKTNKKRLVYCKKLPQQGPVLLNVLRPYCTYFRNKLQCLSLATFSSLV